MFFISGKHLSFLMILTLLVLGDSLVLATVEAPVLVLDSQNFLELVVI